jgi:hypothetical protein
LISGETQRGIVIAEGADIMRRLALFTALTLTASACTMTSSGKKTLVGAGAGTTIAGLLLAAAGPAAVDQNNNGHNGTTLDDDWTMPFLGALAVTAGIAMIIGGATADEVPEAEAPLPMQAQASQHPVFAGPPGQATAQLTVQAPVQPTIVVEPLPEVPVDAETLRLAKQTRIVVSAGHCDAARPLLADIAVRSPAYHHALVEGPVIGRCPALRYAK